MDQTFFNADMQLFIDHRVDWERLLRLRHGRDVSVPDELDTYKMILRTAADVCADIQAGAGDHWYEEVELVDSEVRLPPHIVAGYEKLRSAGLTCLTLSPAYGGPGLPLLFNTVFLEMLSRADASLMTILGLQGGVAGDIERYGSEELKQRYLPRFATGELQGSMDLTESQAGSDLGGVVTRAKRENGHYVVDGEKIFITNGSAQIHLLLARDDATFDQSKGTTKGLNLMLCPVMLPNGTRNRIHISRVETKLGIHGSPTCVVEFDGAEAYLLGEAGGGFRAMLDLMNAARLGVAAQAIGLAEAAYRESRTYAEQRVQFGGPIIQQPLVKSMLTLMAINIQAARALLYRTCCLIDMTEAIRAHLASDRGAADPERGALEAEIEHNEQLIRFFTPLCKYYATEISDDVTRNGIQVHGGIGYMAETRVGHYHADSIITTIYEGTSEIQASFALREMSKGALSTTLDGTRGELEGLRPQFPELVDDVCGGIDWINKSLPALMEDLDYALLNAKRISEMVIDVLVSTELLAQAQASEEKVHLAAAFISRHMLAVEMKARRISTGDASRVQQYNRILGLP
jgi:alkylation response protein AidB-like acyl-CoA dehydrogenase